MKHKYNIQRLLMSIVGYQGLPYPGMFFPPRPVGSYTGDEVEIPTSPAPRQELIKGTRLYKQDALGRWYFMPIFIKHKDIRSNDKARSSDNEHTLELENAVISIEGTKNIVRTPLIGRRGSVKELISIGDYKISIAAFIKSTDGSYPEAQITRMKELYNINESVELISVLTDLLLEQGDRIVITDIQYPPTPGVEDGQAVTIECETDTSFELIIQ